MRAWQPAFLLYTCLELACLRTCHVHAAGIRHGAPPDEQRYTEDEEEDDSSDGGSQWVASGDACKLASSRRTMDAMSANMLQLTLVRSPEQAGVAWTVCTAARMMMMMRELMLQVSNAGRRRMGPAVQRWCAMQAA